ncbi:MAG: virulence factor TspB C-terminal domain-related protein [Methylophilus sp.]|uniref:virulence factor TspB C-terminal domain-related protein n=1 Tax=Methylophilus sp. TaxID=29541 RepID=UPI00403547C4
MLLLLLTPVISNSAEEYAKPRFYLSNFADIYYDTQEAACSAGAPRQVANSGTLTSAIVAYSNGNRNMLGTCWIKSTPFNQVGTSVSNLNVLAQHSCPAGYTLGPANQTNIYQRLCTIASCPSGTTLNTATNKCDDNCLPIKGQLASFGLNCSSETSQAMPVCMPNNCAANVIDTASVRLGNCWYGSNTARYTGERCNGQRSSSSFSNPSNENPPPADKPETDCIKQGKSFGYVNGVPVCVPKGSASATPITQTNQNTTTTTNTDSGGNTTSSTTTETKNATQEGDQVTSQIIKTNPDGTKTEETKTEPVYQFCATNPTHPICKKPASEEEEGVDPCEDRPDLPQCYDRGEPTDTDTISSVNKSFSFAPLAMASSAGCPADRVFVLSGRSFTVPFDRFCTLVASLKPLILAFAYMTAAGIMFNGWKNS